jgi:hypothetical protein
MNVSAQLVWEAEEAAHLDPGGMQYLKAKECSIEILGNGHKFNFTVTVDKAEGMLDLINRWGIQYGSVLVTPGFCGGYAFPISIVGLLKLELEKIAHSDDAMHTQLDIDDKLDKAPYLIRAMPREMPNE